MRNLVSLGMLALTALLTACTTGKLATPESDALAKLMQPVADKAVIYLFRNEPASAPWPIPVKLDQKNMGATGANTYFRWEVAPGQHILISDSENQAPLVLETEAGHVYYVWQEVNTGLFQPRTNLVLVERETAEIALRDCYLL